MSLRIQFHGRSRQGGVALFIALILLVVISVLGISAMKMSMFNARVSTGAQVNTMTFQAGESALQAVYEEALDADLGGQNNVILRAMNKRFAEGVFEVQLRCVTASDPYKSGACADSDYMESRDLIKASSQTVVKDNIRNIAGNSVTITGSGGTNVVWYDFVSVAKGEMESIKVESHNVQEFSRKGLYMSGNF